MLKKILLVFLLIAIVVVCFSNCASKTDKAVKFAAQAERSASNLIAIVKEAVRIQQIPEGEIVTIYINPDYDNSSDYKIISPIEISTEGYKKAQEDLKGAFLTYRDQYHAGKIEITSAKITYFGINIATIRQPIIEYADPDIIEKSNITKTSPISPSA